MKIAILVLVLAQTPSANPLSDGARFTYSIMKGNITRSAAKMPESEYAFRPAREARSFAEFIAHVSDSNFRLCSVIAGDSPIDSGIERSGKTQKTELSKILADSFAYCDKVYTNITDATGTEKVRFEAGGEGLRNNIEMPKLTALSFLTMANYEHYGNLVTYMRMKGIVPPSSELPPPKIPTAKSDVPKKTYSDVSGEWNLLVETPNGPIAAVLTLKIEGATVTGEAKSDRGVVQLSGTLSPTEIKFAGKSQTLLMTFSAKPDANAMSGKVEFAGHPSGAWSASRP